MKQFNLEEFLKDPNRKVVTRDGRAVRIICTDFGNEFYPIIGELQDEKEPYPRTFTDTGKHLKDISKDDDLDLFFAPEKKEGCVNVYRNAYGAYVLGEIFIGKEHEEVTTGLTYIATAKIEWEE